MSPVQYRRKGKGWQHYKVVSKWKTDINNYRTWIHKENKRAITHKSQARGGKTQDEHKTCCKPDTGANVRAGGPA